MRGSAAQSPASRQILDLEERISRIKEFVAWGNVSPLNLKSLAPRKLWEKHWENLKKFDEFAREAQGVSNQLKQALQAVHAQGS